MVALQPQLVMSIMLFTWTDLKLDYQLFKHILDMGEDNHQFYMFESLVMDDDEHSFPFDNGRDS